MADWNLPTVTSGYINFVAEMNNKFVDAATLQNGSPINLPENTIRYNRSINLFQEWIAGNWVNKVLSVAGGGTGSTTPGGVVTNLGLGSMALQNSNAVNITGGSITGISFDISSVTTGVLPLARGGTGASLALAGYGEVLMSSGASVVFATGVNITSLNASALTIGTVPAARLTGVGLLASTQTWTGGNTFYNTESGALTSRHTYAVINWFAEGSPVDQKWMRVIYNQGNFGFQVSHDAGGIYSEVFNVGYNSVVTCYGGAIHNLNGSNITLGTVPTARLGSGVANAGTFLRGDSTWQAIDVGSGGGGEPIPSGLIAMFDTNCPAGWTRYSQLDNRFPLGSSGAGGVGGSNTHSHQFDVTSGGGGSHDHSFGGSFNGSGSGSGNFGGNTGGPSQTSGVDAGSSFGAAQDAHTHGFAVAVNLNVNVTTNIDGRTGAGGDHTHRIAGGTNGADHTPPYFTMVFCRKN